MKRSAADLKEALRLEELIGRDVVLKSAGNSLVGLCPFHAEKTPSFRVNQAGQFFKCFGCGVSGDALSWITWKLFGRLESEKAEFVEVLKAGCAEAKWDFQEAFGRPDDEKALKREKVLRAREKIIDVFAKAAVKAWTPEKRFQARQRKPWLSDEIIARWGIGVAPTMAQCKAVGLGEKHLAFVGLLREGKNKKIYLHFRDCMIVPFHDRGRVVYMTSRRLVDHGADMQPLPKEKKALSMPAPGDGKGGVPRPAGFNTDCLFSAEARERGVILVESPLEAISCCEQGQPAIGIIGKRPSEKLIERIKRLG